MRLSAEGAWGDVPAMAGGLKIEAPALGRVTEVLAIGSADVSGRLRDAIGLGWPPAGRSEAKGGIRVIWSGRQAVFVLGAAVDIDGALCVDQSDGWAALELTGEVREVLARLCPLDLRDGSFPAGSAARSLLNHVPVLLTRTSEKTWLLLAPRSMAGTVLEEIVGAAEGVAAR